MRFLFGRDLRPIARLAHHVPTKGGVRCITGPEVESPRSKRQAVGGGVVTLAPSGDGRVRDERMRHRHRGRPEQSIVRFDDGRHETSADEQLGTTASTADAVTVHRMQVATVDRTHVFADDGGRELADVAMSGARDISHAYVLAMTSTRVAEDLTVEWSADCRQRWVLTSTDQP